MSGRKLQDPETRKRLRQIEEGRRLREILHEADEEHARRKEEQRLRKELDEINRQIEEQEKRSKVGWDDADAEPLKDIEEFRKLVEQQRHVVTSDNTITIQDQY